MRQVDASAPHGVTVTGVQRDRRGRVAGIHGDDRGGAGIDIGARYVIGADGLRSRVVHSVGAAINEARPGRRGGQVRLLRGHPACPAYPGHKSAVKPEPDRLRAPVGTAVMYGRDRARGSVK